MPVINIMNSSSSDAMASGIHREASASPQLKLGLVNRDQDLIALEKWQGPGYLRDVNGDAYVQSTQPFSSRHCMLCSPLTAVLHLHCSDQPLCSRSAHAAQHPHDSQGVHGCSCSAHHTSIHNAVACYHMQAVAIKLLLQISKVKSKLSGTHIVLRQNPFI